MDGRRLRHEVSMCTEATFFLGLFYRLPICEKEWHVMCQDSSFTSVQCVKDDFISQRTTIAMAKKPKSRTVAVRLISMAMTGYYKTFSRPRTHRPLSMLKYDPVGMAHPRAETTYRCTDSTCSQEEGSIPRAEEGWEIDGFAE